MSQSGTTGRSRVIALAALCCVLSVQAADYDVVIANGRVMNPASGLDSVRNVGIVDGQIAVLSREAISGDTSQITKDHTYYFLRDNFAVGSWGDMFACGAAGAPTIGCKPT